MLRVQYVRGGKMKDDNRQQTFSCLAAGENDSDRQNELHRHKHKLKSDLQSL